MLTDPIADMLTRIRNAVAVGHEQVKMPASKLREGMAQILVVEGYIDRYETTGDGVQATWSCSSATAPVGARPSPDCGGSPDPVTGSIASRPRCPGSRAGSGFLWFRPPRDFWWTGRPVGVASVARFCVRFGEMSRIGKKPISVPSGVDVKIVGLPGFGQGFKGHARADVLRSHHDRS